VPQAPAWLTLAPPLQRPAPRSRRSSRGTATRSPASSSSRLSATWLHSAGR
jgi:hypothetical protein